MFISVRYGLSYSLRIAWVCGRGRINTYAIFAEGMRQIVNSTGRVGCVVPSGIATDDTTKFFFQDLVEKKSLSTLYSFENEEFIFPAVHHSTRFCLLTVSGYRKQNDKANFVFFARQPAHIKEEWRIFSLSAQDIALLNPNTRTCSIFRSKRDMEITRAIYTRVSVLVKEGSSEINPWKISFRQGTFNMTSDSHLFLTYEQLIEDGWQLRGNIFYRENEMCLPLYEGKMISFYDHRFGTYEGQTEAQANQGKLPELDASQHSDPNLFPLPRYWVRQVAFAERIPGNRKALLAFRDIARSTDNRTSIFSIIPAVPSGNKLPIMLLENSQNINYLAACCSSFIFDYVARQKLGGTSMGFFILKQLPVLPPDQYKAKSPWDKNISFGEWILPRTLELTYTAWDLDAFAKDCCYDGPPFRWNEERRFFLRCELDAAYFHLYGIKHEDVDYVMETFPIVKRKDGKQYGEYRTKRVILEIYDEMKRAMESGEAYQTRLDLPPADVRMAHERRVQA